MNKFTSFLLFIVCCNLSLYVLNASGAYPPPVSPRGYKSADPTSNEFTGMFMIQNLDLTNPGTWVAVGGGIISVLSGVLIGNMFVGMVVALIWVMGCFLTPMVWFLTGVPLFSYDIAVGLGASPVIAGIVQSLITVAFLFVTFMFIMDLFSQR